MIVNECKWSWMNVNDCQCMSMIVNECKWSGMNVNDSEWM